MKQIAMYVFGACLVAAAPLHAASNGGAVAGATNVVVQSEDGSSGSFGSSQNGALDLTGASSGSATEGSLAIPKLGALDGYVGLSGADLAKSSAGFTSVENRGAGAGAVAGVIDRVTSTRLDTSAANSTASSSASSVQTTLEHVQDMASGQISGLDSSAPGMDLGASIRTLTIQGSTR